jgi:hypothetical protein
MTVLREDELESEFEQELEWEARSSSGRSDAGRSTGSR